jgi:AraC-like DNA-binding protein
LKKRDTVLVPAIQQMREDARGILGPGLAHRRFVLQRYPPSRHPGRYVRHYWSVTWDLGERNHVQTVLPHPAVNLVFERHRAAAYGLERGANTQVLTGKGWALGVLFRPAGFAPYYGQPMAQLTGSAIEVEDLFGAAGVAAWEAIKRARIPEARAGIADLLLAELAPTSAPRTELARDVVERIAADSDLTKVEDVARFARCSVRSLQRLFADQVGASPKWVIRRYRLLEAAEHAGRGGLVSWSQLALALGYSDQAHLTREFTSMVGMPPAEYARACVDGRDVLR